MSRVSLLSDLLGSFAPRSWFFDSETTRALSVDELRDRCRKLVRSKGEATGVRIAADILAGVRSLNDPDCEAFFRMLAEDFAPDPKRLVETAKAFAAAPGPGTLAHLQREAEPPRQELFRRLNLAPGGTAELVKLRERLLPLVAKDRETFKPVDMDLRHLFGSWFNRGFLVLKPIDWDTSARILEKIIAYEAVHAISDWDALRSRLEPSDRRCFAFFHPSIPDDPLIFVEVALTREIPVSIGEVLADDRAVLAANEAETATFYSISNCHKGLAGVSFGSFLIKQVAEDLKESIPNLKTFVTLSPVPTFTAWLNQLDDAQRDRLEASEKRALEILEEDGWAFDEEKAEAAKPGVLALAARYFLLAKREDGQPVDPVARFHLGNGAMLNRIMHRGDVSTSGLTRASGLMVNYLYDLPRVEDRHEAYADASTVAASRQVTTLLPSSAERAFKRDHTKGQAA
ncbi:malonyl-CoA decarboxylase protein [Fulvimarina pelagi HTCC2506]|uniref:Malonyl-CoA decarboxylase protein n=1 Tax=Fulvimarina pelagi HTCC2506 TaxID=314231 RepID=Q0FXK2_9HYPH|nr:malonyl-CoA decarboxylase [Fulvimarina pelagi]EAU39734.1 malonyl-CoA decarboxylase protein [Fulvimarina pelagi HTCC2506]